MVRLYSILFLLSTISATVATAVECPPSRSGYTTGEIVERINRRYDDFFRLEHEREEREAEIRQHAHDVKKARQKRAERLERAREEYVKNRPPREEESEILRKRWEAEEKDRRQRLELARDCYIKNQEEAQEILNRGRRIPELREYNLQDY
ncbi:MAG: hypothetical protein AB7G93_13535 [Bdellovibrionales bacterium]